MEKNSRIYVAGHTGMVGSAIVRCLRRNGYENIIQRTHQELDLTNQAECEKFFEEEKPEYVFLAAAKVGGILANDTYPADFIMENMLIECNVIRSAFKNKVKKLMFFGSSCIYPKLCPQPIKEKYLLTGPLEPTNEAYALAKISGIKMCQAYNKQYGTRYISVMPANLYGINDRFDAFKSHVIPSMMVKFHRAKLENRPFVELWGTGKPLREFLYVDDMAEACLYLMENYEGSELVNIGSGMEISIKELAEIIRDVVGFQGEIVFDSTKPDGTPRRVLDNSKISATGWKPKVDLKEGIRMEYEFYLNMLKNN
ncbi:MAG TPA: GDP-L-fucose synthase [Clostridiaceae bacterium]|nr:GDP-L-fucose synthase [Clostridiaceae bacterium]